MEFLSVICQAHHSVVDVRGAQVMFRGSLVLMRESLVFMHG